MEAEEEYEAAEDGAWQDSDLDSDSGEEQEDQQDSGSDRDTHFNPDSSPKLPVDLNADADRIAHALAKTAPGQVDMETPEYHAFQDPSPADSFLSHDPSPLPILSDACLG